jgi:hypothetical protein
VDWSLVRYGPREQWCGRSRNGKVMKVVFYFDRELALTDLGLLPEADSPGS